MVEFDVVFCFVFVFFPNLSNANLRNNCKNESFMFSFLFIQ